MPLACGAHNGCMLIIGILLAAAIVLAPFGTDSRPEWSERNARRSPLS